MQWFKEQYDAQLNDARLKLEVGRFPSVVAHSFGTCILGTALIRYPFIRLEKVLLCGSILPIDFPWDELIARGQVQAVRNEHGVRDPWVKAVRWFVRGTGPSGADGFTCTHDRLEQKKFEYAHSEYFAVGHMEHYWIPFLEAKLKLIPEASNSVASPKTHAPWGFYACAPLIIIVICWLLWIIIPLLFHSGMSLYNYVWSPVTAQPREAPVSYISTAYIKAIERAQDAAQSNNWSHVKAEFRGKHVRWDAFVCSVTDLGYYIQPRETASQDSRWNAGVALSDRRHHPQFGVGRAVTVTGRITKFDHTGITIVGAISSRKDNLNNGAD